MTPSTMNSSFKVIGSRSEITQAIYSNVNVNKPVKIQHVSLFSCIFQIAFLKISQFFRASILKNTCRQLLIQTQVFLKIDTFKNLEFASLSMKL